jgi:hypothetical protein
MRVNEGKLPRILSVKAAGEFRLRLRFANGKSFAIDLSREVRRVALSSGTRQPSDGCTQ